MKGLFILYIFKCNFNFLYLPQCFLCIWPCAHWRMDAPEDGAVSYFSLDSAWYVIGL